MSDVHLESCTPVVLVHSSLATGTEKWGAQRPLADEGFRLLVLDRRGNGEAQARTSCATQRTSLRSDPGGRRPSIPTPCSATSTAEMDGHEVARTMRADPELGRVRLVALSTCPAGRRGDGQGGRIDAHLAKPPQPRDVRAGPGGSSKLCAGATLGELIRALDVIRHGRERCS
jgi:CheY-like chemotaxis protein